MKRYRVLEFNMDSRAIALNAPIADEIKEQIRQELIQEFGSLDSEVKLQDFVDIGPIPFSVIDYHNRFLHQARQAFVIGAYYPSLTASCALGERILNHLVLRLRDCYSDTVSYRKVARQKSFDDWNLMITTLESWRVLLPEVVNEFRKMISTRNVMLHFNPDTDIRDRTMAITAFRRIRTIVELQFGFDGQPWYIEGTGRAFFIKKSWESNPFVREVILPNCVLVGYLHTLESALGNLGDVSYHEGNACVGHEDE